LDPLQRPADRLVDSLAWIVATAGGAGYAPVAPGTVASAATVLVLVLLPGSALWRVGFLVLVTLAGTVAADRVERAAGTKDPGFIVVDEVAGMTLSVLWLPLTPAVLAAAFVLFRVLDVVKPFPANRSQALPGGLGVMADDLIAGLYVLLILTAARAWPGVPV
jgi:phosphatidylglycerophosphatase A